MDKLVIVVVVAILIAGCTGDAEQQPPTETVESPTPTADSVSTTPTDRTPTPTPAPTTTATPTPEPVENPWERQEVIVSINDSGVSDRNYEPHVREAVGYWNKTGRRYATYDATFILDPDAPDADIEIRFVEWIDNCGFHTDVALVSGCANLLTKNTNPDELEVVEILGGLVDEDIEGATKHELGHILGLDHDDSPEYIMRPSADRTLISHPDAKDRDYPWRTTQLAVYVDYGEMPGHEKHETERQVEYALEYYEEGAGGFMAQDVDFYIVETNASADIVVLFTDYSRTRGGSLGRVYGVDIDTDDDLEYYTRGGINVYNIPTDRRGWHVGYWLGYAFGADSVSDLPPPFDEPEHDAREQWW